MLRRAMHPAATAAVTGLALSADAVAVAIAASAAAGSAPGRGRRALAMAATFGGFQALMPLLGWLGGAALKQPLAAVDHWIAFALLLLVGGKMAWEGWRADGDDEAAGELGWRRLVILGVATSIDALAVGVTFAFIAMPLLLTVAIIGLTTFACCLPAGLLGARLAAIGHGRVQMAGGLVLVGLGAKILVEHLHAA